MYYKFSLSKPRHLLTTAALILLLLFFIAPTAHAIPNDSPPSSSEEILGWVDLQATVPEGFNGSVSVQLMHADSGEVYTLTSYLLNDYCNSKQLPLGKYTIERAFTSEDSFLYEAFIDLDDFELKTSKPLDVTVKENPDGALILEELSSKPEEPEVPDKSEPETPAVPPSESVTESEPEPSEPAIDTSSEEPFEPDDQSSTSSSADSSNVSEQDGNFSVLERIGMTIVATVIFVGIVFFIVYIVRCYYNR